jgi:hypothetical protein
MGSLLESYMRRRDRRNFLRSQGDAIAAQLNAVDEQVRRLLDRHARDRSELGRSHYLHHYLVGTLDAITSFYERETRKRHGFELYRHIFARYLQARFRLKRREADKFFSGIPEDFECAGIADGYADGLQVLRRRNATHRLLDHFAGRPERVEIAEPEADEEIRRVASM